MATSKEITGTTPNGGVRAVIYFRDSNGDPVDESKATGAEIIEFDESGDQVGRTYGTIGSKDEDDGIDVENNSDEFDEDD